jgi:hypothetical protein
VALASGDLTRAEDTLRRPLDISAWLAAVDARNARAQHGPSNLEALCDLAVPANNPAGVLASMGDAGRVREVFERTYNAYPQAPREDHPGTSAVGRNMRAAQAGTRDIFKCGSSLSSRNPVSTRKLSAGGDE